MSNTQEANTAPEVTVVTSDSGAVTATVPADFTKPVTEDKSLLAGKFKTPGELEKAYKELETKLGQTKPQSPAEEATTKTEAEDPAKTEETPEGEKPEGEAEALDEVYAPYGENIGKALKEAGIDPTVAQKEFEETGALSEATREAYDTMFGKEVVDAYLRGVATTRSEQAAITDVQITQIKAVAGGEEGFTKLQGWMASNLPAAELTAYNGALQSGDANQITAAVSKYNALYQADVGREGKLLGGKAAAADPGYASDAEYLKDMANPQYKVDPAYREAVARKLAQSPNVMRMV